MAESVRRTTSQSPRSSGIVDHAEPPLRIATFNLNSYEEEKNTTPSADVSATLATILSHFDLVLMLERRRPGNDTNIDRLIRRLHTVDRAEPFDFEESQSVCKIHGAEHYCFFYRSSRLSVADVHKFKREESLGRKGGKKRQDEGDSSPDRHAPGASGVATDHDTTKPGVSDMKDGDVPQLPQVQPPSPVACLASTSSLAGSMASTSMAVVPSLRLVPHGSVSPAEGAVTDAPSVATLPSLATSPSQPVSTTHLDVQAKESQGQSSVLVEGGSAQPSPKASRFAVTKVSHAELSGITEGQSYENDMETLDVTEVTKISQCKLPGMAEGQSSAEGMERNVIQVTKVSPAEPSGVFGRISSENESKGKADVDSSEVFRFDETKVTKSDLFYLNQGQSDEQSLEATDGTDEFPSVVSNSELTEVNISDSTDEKSQEAREGIRVSVSEPPQRKKSEVTEVVPVLEARALSASLSSSGSPQKEERGSLDTATTSTDSEDVYLPDVIHREVLPVAKMGVSAPQPDLVTPEYDFTKSASLPDTGIGQTHPSSRNMSVRTCTLTPVVDRERCETEAREEKKQALVENIPRLQTDDETESQACKSKDSDVIGDSQISLLADLMSSELDLTSSPSANIIPQAVHSGTEIEDYHHPMVVHRDVLPVARRGHSLHEPQPIVPECDLTRSPSTSMESISEVTRMLQRHHPPKRGSHTPRDGDSLSITEGDSYPREVDAGVVMDTAAPETQEEEPRVDKEGEVNVAHTECFFGPEQDEVTEKETDTEIYVSKDEEVYFPERPHVSHTGRLHGPEQGQVRVTEDAGEKADEVESHALETGKDAVAESETLAVSNKQEQRYVQAIGAGEKPQYHVQVVETERADNSQNDAVMSQKDKVMSQRDEVMSQKDVLMSQKAAVMSRKDVMLQKDEVLSQTDEAKSDTETREEGKPALTVILRQTQCVSGQGKDSDVRAFVHHKLTSDKTLHHTHTSLFKSEEATLQCRSYTERRPETQLRMARKRFETAKVSASQLQLELSLLTEKDMTHSASSGEDGGSRQDIHSDDDEEQTSAHSNLQDNDMVPSVSGKQTIACQTITHKSIGKRLAKSSHITAERSFSYKVTFNNEDATTSRSFENKMSISYSRVGQQGRVSPAASQAAEEKASPSRAVPVVKQYPVGHVSGEDAGPSYQTESGAKQPATLQVNAPERIVSWHDELTPEFQGEASKTKLTDDDHGSIMLIEDVEPGPTPAPVPSREQSKTVLLITPVQSVTHLIASTPKQMSDISIKQQQQTGPSKETSQISLMKSSTALNEDESKVSPEPEPKLIPAQSKDSKTTLVKPAQVIYIPPSRGFSRDLMPIVLPPGMSIIVKQKKSPSQEHIETAEIPQTKVFYIPASKTLSREILSIAGVTPEPSESKQRAAASSKENQALTEEESPSSEPIPSKEQSKTSLMSRPIGTPSAASLAPATQSGTAINRVKSETSEILTSDNVRPQTKTCLCCKTVFTDMTSEDDPLSDVDICANCRAVFDQIQSQINQRSKLKLSPPSKTASKVSQLSERQMSGVSINAEPVTTQTAQVNGGIPSQTMTSEIQRVTSQTSNMLQVAPLAETKPCIYCKTDYVVTSTDDGEISEVEMCVTCKIVLDEMQSRINRVPEAQRSPPIKPAPGTSMRPQDRTAPSSEQKKQRTSQMSQVKEGLLPKTVAREIQSTDNQMSNVFNVIQIPEARTCIYCKTEFIVTPSDDGEISEVEVCVTCKIILDEMQSRVNREPKTSYAVKSAPGTSMSLQDRTTASREQSMGNQILSQLKWSLPSTTVSREIQSIPNQMSSFFDIQIPEARTCHFCKTEFIVTPSDDGEISEVEVCVTCKIILDEMQSRVNREPKTSYAIKPAPGTSMSLQDRTTASREQSMGNQIISQLKWSLPPSTLSRGVQSMDNQMSNVFNVIQIPETRTCIYCKAEFTVMPSVDGEKSEVEVCVTCKIILDEMQSRVNREPKTSYAIKPAPGTSMSLQDRTTPSREQSMGNQILSQLKWSLPPSTVSRKTQSMSNQMSSVFDIMQMPEARTCHFCKTEFTVTPSDDGEISEAEICVTCKIILDEMQSRVNQVPEPKANSPNKFVSGISMSVMDRPANSREPSTGSQILQFKKSLPPSTSSRETQPMAGQKSNTPGAKPCIYCKTDNTVKPSDKVRTMPDICKASADDGEIPEVKMCVTCKTVLDKMQSRFTPAPVFKTSPSNRPASGISVTLQDSREQPNSQMARLTSAVPYKIPTIRDNSGPSQIMQWRTSPFADRGLSVTESTSIQVIEQDDNTSYGSSVYVAPITKPCIYCKTEFVVKLSADDDEPEVGLCAACQRVLDEMRPRPNLVSRVTRTPQYQTVSYETQVSEPAARTPIRTQARGQQTKASQSFSYRALSGGLQSAVSQKSDEAANLSCELVVKGTQSTGVQASEDQGGSPNRTVVCENVSQQSQVPEPKTCVYCKTEFTEKLGEDGRVSEIEICFRCRTVFNEVRSRTAQHPITFEKVSRGSQASDLNVGPPVKAQPRALPRGQQSSAVQTYTMEVSRDSLSTVCQIIRENLPEVSQIPETKACVCCKTVFTVNRSEDGQVSEVEMCVTCKKTFDTLRFPANQGSALRMECPSTSGHQPNTSQTSAMQVSPGSLSAPCTITSETRTEIIQTPEAKTCHCCNTVFTVTQSEGGEVSEIEMCVTCKTTFDKLRFPANQGSAVRRECPSASGYQPKSSQGSGMYVSRGVLSAPCKAIPENRAEVRQIPATKTCVCCKTVFTETWCEDGDVSEVEMCVTCKTTFHELRSRASPSKSDRQLKANEMPYSDRVYAEMYTDERGFDTDRMRSGISNVLQDAGGVRVVRYQQTSQSPEIDRNRQYRSAYSGHLPTTSVPSGAVTRGQYSQGSQPVRQAEVIIERDDAQALLYAAAMVTVNALSEARKEVRIQGDREKAPKPQRGLRTMTNKGAKHWDGYTDEAGFDPDLTRESWTCITSTDDDKDKAKTPSAKPDRTDSVPAYVFDDAGFDPEKMRTLSSTEVIEEITPASAARMDSVIVVVSETSVFDPQRRQTIKMTQTCHYKTPSPRPEPLDRRSRTDVRERVRDRDRERDREGVSEPARKSGDEEARPAVGALLLKDEVPTEEYKESAGIDPEGIRSSFTDVPDMRYSEGTWSEVEYGEYESPFDEMVPQEEYDTSLPEVELSDHISSGSSDATPESPETDILEYETGVLEYETGIPEFEHTVAVQTDSPWTESSPSDEEDGPMRRFSSSVDWHFSEKPESDTRAPRLSKPIEGMFGTKSSAPDEWQSTTEESVYFIISPIRHTQATGVSSTAGRQQAIEHPSTVFWQEAARASSAVNQQQVRKPSSAVAQQQVRKPSSAVDQQQVRKPSSAVDQQQVRKPSSAVDQQEVRKPSSAVDWKQATLSGVWQQRTGPPTGAHWQEPIRSPAGTHWQQATGPPSGVQWQQASGPPTGAQWQQATVPPPGVHWQQATGPPPGAQWQQAAGPPPGAQWQQTTGPPPGAQWQQATGLQWQQATGPPTGAQWQQATVPPPGAHWQQATGPPPGAYWQQATGPPPGAHWQQATGPPPGVHWQQETQPPSGVWQQTTGSTTAVNQQHKPKTSAVSFQRASGSQSGFSRQKTSRSPSTVHRQQASRSPSTVSQQRERKSAADWHHPIRPSSAVDRHQFYPTRQSSAVDWIHTTRGSSAVDWHHPIIAARTSSAVDWKHTRRPSSAVDWLYSMRPSSAVDWLHSPRRSSFADWLLSPGTSNTTDWFYSGESPDRSFRRASRVPARQDPQYRSDVGPDRDARLARRVSSRPEYRTDDGPERDSRQFSRVSRSTRRESQAEGSSRARRLSSPTDWQDTPDYIVLPEIPVETQSVGTSPHLPPTRSTSTETEFQASKSVITERAPTKTTATEKKLYTSKSVSCVQDSLPVKFFADQPPKSVIMVSKSAACVEAPEEWQPEKVTASVSSEAMLQEEKAANTINKRPVVKTTGTATNLQATKSISTVVARDLGSVDPYDPWGECDTADGEILGRLSSPVDYKHSSAVDWQHSSDFVLLGPESDKFTPPIDSSVDYECVPDFFVPQKTRRRSSTADLEFYAPGDHIIQNREAKERQRKESSSADAGYVSDNIMMRSTMPYRPPSSVDLDYKSDFIMFPSKYKHMPRTSTMADETRSDFVIMPTRYTDGSTHDIYLPALPSKVMSQVDTEYKSAYITLTPKTKLDTSQYPVTVREAGTTNEDDGQAKKPVLVSAQGKAAPVSTPLPVSAKAAHTRAPTTSAHRVSFSERREYSQDPRCSTSKDEKIIEPRMGMNFKTHTSYTRDENQEDDDTEEGPGPAKLPWDNEFLRSVATTTRLPQAISTFSQTLQTIAMVSKSVACMDTDSLYKADADTEGAPRVVITSPEFAPRSIGVGTDVMLDAGPSTAVATNIQIARSLAAATEENDQEGAPAEFPILIVKSPGEATYESVGVEAHIKMGRTYATQTGWEPCFKDQWQNTELVYQDLDQFRIMPGDFAMNSVATMTDKAIMSSVGVTADLPEKFSASVDTYKPNAVFRELYELVGYLDLGPDWKHLCTTGIQTDTIKEEAETQTSNRKKRKPPPGCFDAMKIAAPWIPPEPEDSRESTISLTGKIVHATARRQSFLDHLRPGRGQRENSSNEYYTEYDRKRSAAIGIPGTAYGKPGTAHGKPSTAYGKPGTAHGKPSTDYGKPGTAHGKPGTAHGKPGTAYGPSTSHRRSAGANRNSNPNANPDRGVEPESKSRWRDAKSPGENVNPNANPGVVIIKAPKTTSRSVNTPPTTSRDMATETAIVVVKSPYQPMTESIGTETNIQIARTCGTETDDDQEAKSDFPVIIVQSPGDGNFQSIGVEADIKLARTLATQTGEDVSTKNFGVNTDITVQYPDFIKPIPPDFEEKEEGTQTRFLLSSSVAVQVAMSEAPEKDQCMIPFESCGAVYPHRDWKYRCTTEIQTSPMTDEKRTQTPKPKKKPPKSKKWFPFLAKKEPEPPSDEDMEISGRLVEPRPYTMWGREERSENSGSYSEQEETRRSHARENTSPNANPGREKRVKTLAFRRSVSSNQGDSSNNKGEDASATPQEGCTHDKTHSCQHKEQGEATEQDRPRDTIEDTDDLMHVFLCEPFAVRFASPTTAVTDFAVLVIHTDPRDAKLEVCGIQHLYNATRTRWWLEDMLIAGDFTMVDSYDEMEDWLPIEHRSDRRFTRLVENEDVDEPVVSSKECGYDRLILVGKRLVKSFIPGSSGIFRFDQQLPLSLEQAEEVSDHYPLQIKIAGAAIYNRWHMNIATHAGVVIEQTKPILDVSHLRRIYNVTSGSRDAAFFHTVLLHDDRSMREVQARRDNVMDVVQCLRDFQTAFPGVIWDSTVSMAGAFVASRWMTTSPVAGLASYLRAYLDLRFSVTITVSLHEPYLCHVTITRQIPKSTAQEVGGIHQTPGTSLTPQISPRTQRDQSI